MFDFLDTYIDRITPHAVRVGVTAQTYAERIIARLDTIAAAVQDDDEFDERRVRIILNGPQGTAADTSTWTEIQQVPVGQSWELELASLAATGASSASLAIDYTPVVNLVVNGAPGITKETIGLHLYSGDTIKGFIGAAGTTLYLQFKVRHKRPIQITRHAGAIDQAPDRTDQRGEGELERRHLPGGNLTPGVNVIGARHN